MIQNIADIAAYLFLAFKYAMVIYILSSWLPSVRESKPMMLLGKVVEPYLSLFRKIIPPLGMIDVSPIVAFLAYQFLAGCAVEGMRTVLGWI